MEPYVINEEGIIPSSKIKKLLKIIFSALVIGVLVGTSYFGYYLYRSRRDGVVKSPFSAGGFEDFENVFQGEPEETGGKEGGFPSPINGVFYSKDKEEYLMKRRPMAVMINNHTEARPQTNLSKADLIYEAVAEGGITRFLAIYHAHAPEKVGPARSSRVYYVDWAKEYDAWYAFHGRAQIDPNNPEVCDPRADTFTRMQNIYVSEIEDANSCWREPQEGLAIEHTLYCSVPKFYDYGYTTYPDQVTNWRGIGEWAFKDDVEELNRPSSAAIEFNFWGTLGYEVKWEYDPKENVYLRYQGGELQKDAATGESLKVKNVIVQFMVETALNDLKNHILYQTVGEGEAKIFRDGQIVEAVWERPAIEDRTQYYESGGKKVEFNRGQIWIEVLPVGTSISYS